jgi:hypothetical protein
MVAAEISDVWRMRAVREPRMIGSSRNRLGGIPA